MAKLSKVSQETQNLVDEYVSEVGLDNFMNVKCLSITKQKQIVKVARANATTEFYTQSPDTVILYIYEAVFDRLTDRQKELVLKDSIAQIYFDTEKDKITITQPQICMTVGGRQKWGEELADTLEACVLIQEQLEEEEKERKAAEREAKKKK
jgi:hypothetical protein